MRASRAALKFWPASFHGIHGWPDMKKYEDDAMILSELYNDGMEPSKRCFYDADFHSNFKPT